MNATKAVRHDRANWSLQWRARLHSDGAGATTADVVPPIANRLMKTHRFLAFVAAILITFFLAWVFAREKVGVPPDLTRIATSMDAAKDTVPTAV